MSDDAPARETDHRLRAQLQLVVSLLGLQAAYAAGDRERAALERAAARILGLAAVQAARDAAKPDRIRLDVMVQRLVEGLTAAQPAADVRLRLAAVDLSWRQASVLAIALQELLDNALRHGLRGRPGRVSVECEATDNQLTLRVADDGHGLPAHFQLERDKGLGLVIAETMAGDGLGGGLRLMGGPGTVAEIAFPSETPADRAEAEGADPDR